MKRSVMFLVLTGALLLTAPLTFADVVHLLNEDDSSAQIPADAWANTDSMATSNTQENTAENSEDNTDVTKMPFVPDDNSDNGVLETAK